MTEPDLLERCEKVAHRCAGFSVRRAARVVAGLYDEALAPAGLKGTQFSLLNAIAVAGAPRITRLAAILLMDRTTLTRNLKPLSQEGLVRVTQTEDRRAKTVSLTPKGLGTLRKALPLWERAQHSVAVLLGEARLKRLRDDLRLLEQLDKS